MMRGLSPTLEKHHGVRILDEAVSSAVRLSHRYIPARQLPDKAVSVLDTACARVAIGQQRHAGAGRGSATGGIDALDTETRILERESAPGADHAERLAELAADARPKPRRAWSPLEARWKQELELVGPARAPCRTRLAAGRPTRRAPTAPKPPTKAEQAKLRAELDEAARPSCAQLQGEQPLIRLRGRRQAIAEVVSGWTGIPVGRMVADEIRTVLDLAGPPASSGSSARTHALEAIAQRDPHRARQPRPIRAGRSACSCWSGPAAWARPRPPWRWPSCSTAASTT